MSPLTFAARAGPLLCMVLAACDGEAPTLPATAPGIPAPAATLVCTVVTRQPSLACADIAAPARANLILGGQGVRVRLASSGTTYDSATRVMRSSVTVQNLLAGPMGTPDGVAVYGEKVFFHAGPTTTAGSGSVQVANPDGVGAFTGAAQSYFHYAQILPPGAVSLPREWRFAVDPGVERFEFLLYVETRLPIETGVLRWVPRTLCDGCTLRRIWHPVGDTLVIVGDRGEDGLVLRSFDGGATWDSVRVLPPGRTSLSLRNVTGSGRHLYALAVAGPSGGHELLRSDDTGATWELVPPIPNGEDNWFTPDDLWAMGEEVFVGGVSCGDYYEGICYDDAPFVLRSSDGLRTSTLRRLPHTYGEEPALRSIWGSAPNDVYLALDEGNGWRARVLRSIDGGSLWSTVYLAEMGDLYGTVHQVTGADAGHLWLVRSLWVGGSYIEGSTDNGAHWELEDTKVHDAAYRRMWAAAPDHVFVVSNRGIFRRVGTTWWNQPASVAGDPFDLSGTGASNVFVLTGGGQVLHGMR